MAFGSDFVVLTYIVKKTTTMSCVALGSGNTSKTLLTEHLFSVNIILYSAKIVKEVCIALQCVSPIPCSFCCAHVTLASRQTLTPLNRSKVYSIRQKLGKNEDCASFRFVLGR